MDAKERSKNFFKLALCLFLVPVLGWLTSLYLIRTYEGQFREAIIQDKKEGTTAAEYDQQGISYFSLCAQREKLSGAQRSGADKLCEPAENTELLRTSVLLTAGIGAVLVLLIYGARFFAGTNRARMSAVFGPLVRVVMMLLAISVIAQSALLIYSVYVLEAAAVHRVHFGILLAVGIGAVVAGVTLLRAAFSVSKSEPSFARATLVGREKEPRLHALVDVVAKNLRAQPPDQIIIGLDPNCYVTVNDLNIPLPEKKLTGRTLYMSLGLMRIFNVDELAAVIGHELGHFRGKDTEYSMKFAPTYSRLGSTIGAMAQRAGNASDLAKVPALAALAQCWLEFATSERAVSRDRELLADKAGAEAANPRALATALVKVAMLAPVWQYTQKSNIDELAAGRMVGDLSSAFAFGCNAIQSEAYWETNRGEIGQNVQPHPVDTHPSLAVRLANLDLSVNDIAESELAAPKESAATLLSNANAVGEELTLFEDRFLVAIKAVVVPESKSEA